jgi:hypothetical protein
MVRLQTLKNSNRLRQYTDLRPIIRCKTRWSGSYFMLSRFFQIKDYVKEICKDDELLDDLYSTMKIGEFTILESLLQKMTQLNSVMVKLQERNITLSVARKLFDHTLIHFPTMSSYLLIDSPIVHSPVFESALIKVCKKVSGISFSKVFELI